MTKIILPAVFALCAIPSHAQVALSKTFDLEDPNDLLIRLFDADSITAYGEALWEPLTFADELSANVSDDDWMHTRLDTLLFFNAYNVERAVAVFETLHYERGEVIDCQSCGAQISVAIFEKTATGKWDIERFQKQFTTQGTFGSGGV